MRARFMLPALSVLAVAQLLACGSTAPSSQRTTSTPTRDTSASQPAPFHIIARYDTKSTGLRDPRHLAVAPDGNLYITEGGAQRVAVVSPHGKVLRRFGGPGSGPGQFHFIGNDPTDHAFLTAKVAVGPDGLVYVSDSGNGRIEVFTPGGRFLRQFGSFGSGPGQLLRPFDLVADDDGNVYVIDDGRTTGQITKFSPTGRVVWRLTDEAGPDLFTGHLHVMDIDAHGRLVLGNDDLGRVIYLSQDDHEVEAFGHFGPADACEVTVDPAGRTYVSGCVPGDPTHVFDRNHHLIGTWSGPPALLTSPDFAPDGTGYALDWHGSIIVIRISS